jgi:hypothetical protein
VYLGVKLLLFLGNYKNILKENKKIDVLFNIFLMVLMLKIKKNLF